MIEIVDSDSGFDALRDTWNEMARNEAWNSFLWCREAWKCQRGSLRILVWSRDAQRAIFPFFVDAKGTLRLIGDELSDGGDVVCDSKANLYWAFREAADAVSEMRDVKRVWLMKTPANSQLLAHWSAMWPQCVVFKAPATTFLHVPETNDVVRAMPGLKRKDHGRLDAIARFADGYSFELRTGGNFPRAEIEELRAAIKASIVEKDKDLKGNMDSEGTTPRQLTDLIGSLCDLTSGSGDKGTPVVLIQNYFDNYSKEN